MRASPHHRLPTRRRGPSTTPTKRPSQSRARLATLCALATIATLTLLGTNARPAHALTESRAWAGAFVGVNRPGSGASQLGPGLQLGMNLSLGDFWTLQAGLDGAYHFGRTIESDIQLSPLLVTNAFFGVQYRLDIIKYVPYVGLALVGYPLGPTVDDAATRAQLGLKLTVGLNWRPAREWSIGGFIDLHGSTAALTAFDAYATAGLNVGYHWRW